MGGGPWSWSSAARWWSSSAAGWRPAPCWERRSPPPPEDGRGWEPPPPPRRPRRWRPGRRRPRPGGGWPGSSLTRRPGASGAEAHRAAASCSSDLSSCHNCFLRCTPMISADRIPVRPSESGQSVPPVRVRYNPRLRRRASARLEGGTIVVELPATLSAERAQAVTDRLVAGLVGRRRTLTVGDEELAARAQVLADRYLDGVRARSVRWSPRQGHRWGSCSLPAGDIRVSERLRP